MLNEARENYRASMAALSAAKKALTAAEEKRASVLASETDPKSKAVVQARADVQAASDLIEMAEFKAQAAQTAMHEEECADAFAHATRLRADYDEARAAAVKAHARLRDLDDELKAQIQEVERLNGTLMAASQACNFFEQHKPYRNAVIEALGPDRQPSTGIRAELRLPALPRLDWTIHTYADQRKSVLLKNFTLSA